MSSLTIPAERIALVNSTIGKFLANFHKPIDSVDDFVSILHPDVDWYDHAFLMHRIGHSAIVGLHRSFTHCNQPFDAQVKASAKLSWWPRYRVPWLESWSDERRYTYFTCAT